MKTEEKIPDLSNEDFALLIVDIIKAVAKENVNSSDQIEGMLIAMISCAIANGISPDSLLMFAAKGIVAVSSISGNGSKENKPKPDKSTDFDALIGRLPTNSLKN